MSGRERDTHPHLLPWYAAGKLDAVEARKVEEHLERCEECAAVAGPIGAMSRSLRTAARGCVDVEDLTDWEAGRVRGDPARAARIEAHLSGCATCRDDLTAIRRARRGVSMRGRRLAWWLGAAAAVILLGVALPVISSWWRSPEPGSVVLLPASRNGDPVPSIDGTRQWTVECVLPFSATSLEYTIRVEREDGSVIRRVEESQARGNDARLRLLLDPFPQAGLYRIVLEPAGGAPEPAHVYRIRVQP